MNSRLRAIATIAALGALGVGVCVPASAQTNLLTNGSFETGDFTGWTVNATFTDVVTGPGEVTSYSAQDGIYLARLGNTGGLGTISQSFKTTIGQTYQLTYWLANNDISGEGGGLLTEGGLPSGIALNDAAPGYQTPNEFSAAIDGITLSDSVDLPQQDYTQYTFNFVATNAFTALTFSERDDPSYLALDNVSVTEVAATAPEPGSLGLIVFAAAGLPIMGAVKLSRRRRQRIA